MAKTNRKGSPKPTTSSRIGPQADSLQTSPVQLTEKSSVSEDNLFRSSQEDSLGKIESDSSLGSSTSYDQVPYPSHPYAASHPDRLFSIGKIFGLRPPTPERARILELGCASGGNLLPMAAQLTQASFVGVDLSAFQIAEGKRAIDQLGLKNVRLLQADIANLPEDIGEFDYIICHGVFSWVPANVRHAILQSCGQRLTANGIAYVSYNTLPGWYMRNMIRGMMLKHVGGTTDPTTKLTQARALLRFLVESTANESSPFAAYLRSETDLLNKQSDQYLYHDHLEEHNEPMFFQDFISLAQQHGLQFLGESSLASMWIGNLPAKASETLEQLTNDIVLRGQYSDYVRNRTFRQTLLCRNALAIDRQLDVNRLADVRFMGCVQADLQNKSADFTDNTETVFHSRAGHRLASSDPTYKTLLSVMSDAYPSSLDLDQICKRINERFGMRLQKSPNMIACDREIVGRNLIQLMLSGVLDFRYGADRFNVEAGEKPCVSSWARWQAQAQAQVTNLRHELVQVCDVTRILLPLFDGSRTRTEIALQMSKLIDDGSLNLNSATNLTDQQKLKILMQMSDKILAQLAGNALLCA